MNKRQILNAFHLKGNCVCWTQSNEEKFVIFGEIFLCSRWPWRHHQNLTFFLFNFAIFHVLWVKEFRYSYSSFFLYSKIQHDLESTNSECFLIKYLHKNFDGFQLSSCQNTTKVELRTKSTKEMRTRKQKKFKFPKLADVVQFLKNLYVPC